MNVQFLIHDLMTRNGLNRHILFVLQLIISSLSNQGCLKRRMKGGHFRYEALGKYFN